jgi:hypothetical protein
VGVICIGSNAILEFHITLHGTESLHAMSGIDLGFSFWKGSWPVRVPCRGSE